MDIAMQEMWKPLKESPWYDVSNFGHVRSWRSRKKGQRRDIPRLIKIHKLHGYNIVILRLVDGDRRTHLRKISRLMAIAFIGEPFTGQVCRHLNDIPDDDRLENLAWGTVADNSEDARRNGVAPLGSRHGMAKLSPAQVQQIQMAKLGRGDARRLSRELGVSEALISMIRNGHIWKEVV